MALREVAKVAERPARRPVLHGVPRVGTLGHTCELLKSKVYARTGISELERQNMLRMVDELREDAESRGSNSAEHHELFRKALAQRAGESKPLQKAWLKFQRLVKRGSTQSRIDAAIESSFENDAQFERAIKSLHADILLRHFGEVSPQAPADSKPIDAKLIAQARGSKPVAGAKLIAQAKKPQRRVAARRAA